MLANAQNESEMKLALLATSTVVAIVLINPLQAETLSVSQMVTPSQIDEWVDGLHSDRFAERERAASELMSAGWQVVEPLRKRLDTITDPEARDRVEEIVIQLAQSDLQMKIDKFLGGDDSIFPPWPTYRDILGDEPAIRETFLQVRANHPELIDSLDGDAQERFNALETIIQRIRDKQTLQFQTATSIDTLAPLILLSMDDVTLLTGHETEILRLLRRTGATELLRDVDLRVAFDRVASKFLMRVSKANLAEAIFVAVNGKYAAATDLMKRSLTPETDAEALDFSLRFSMVNADPKLLPVITTLLDDERIVGDTTIVNGKVCDTQIRDIASIVIAKITGHSLDEIGVPVTAFHRQVGLDPGRLGFPRDDPGPRNNAISLARKWSAEAQK
ncbi:MAG: hypothetical protein AAF664_01795 [Planctomycetota bacterium]